MEETAKDKLHLSQEELQGWKVSDDGRRITAKVVSVPPDLPPLKPEELNDTDREQLQGLMYLSDSVYLAIARYQHTLSSTKHLPVDDIDRAKRRAVLSHLHDVIQDAELLARTLAINNVKGNHLSRVEVARLLGVHQATIARWVNQAAAQDHNDTETRST